MRIFTYFEKKLIMANKEKIRRERKLLLDRNFENLTEDEQLNYIKAYVFDFLKNSFQHYEEYPLEGFLRPYIQTLDKIDSADSLSDIDIVISIFSQYLKNWKGVPFVESAIENYYKEIAHQLGQMTNILHNLKFYSSLGINIRGASCIKRNATYYKLLTKGLPSNVVKEVLNKPDDICIIYVSGSGINIYGHALLCLGKAGFIHIDSLYNYPKHMTIDDFNQYLAIENKVVLGIQKFPISTVRDFLNKLDNLCKQKWLWLAVKHNCLTFCYDAFTKGGYEPEKQDEFKSLIFKLPTNWLSKTSQQHLFADIAIHKQMNIHSYNDLLSSKNILDINIIDFTPEKIIRFLCYLRDNMDIILQWQMRIVGSMAGAFKHSINRSVIDITAENMRLKLADIKDKMTVQYKKLYQVLINSPLFNQLLIDINQAIETSINNIGAKSINIKEAQFKLLTFIQPSTNHIKIQQEDVNLRDVQSKLLTVIQPVSNFIDIKQEDENQQLFSRKNSI